MLWTMDAVAPRLRHVGGSLRVDSASVFDAPKLQTVGRHFEMSDLTRRVSVPMLESVGGNFGADGAEFIVAHRLKRVGAVIDTRNARDFYQPDLIFDEVWLIHPEAVGRWHMRQAVRRVLREQPSIEI